MRRASGRFLAFCRSLRVGSDLVGESLGSLAAKPGRSLLTMLGAVAGTCTLVASLGLTSTVQNQIGEQFDLLAATEVVVQDTGAGTAGDFAFTPRSEKALLAINGVNAGGVMWPVDGKTVEGSMSGNVREVNGMAVYAMSPGPLDVAGMHFEMGRAFDDFSEATDQHVAVLGASVARRLGIGLIDGNRAVLIDGIPFTVVGVVDEVERHPEVLVSVVIPSHTALSLFGNPPSGAQAIVETQLGAAQVVARQVAVALRPDASNRFSVLTPPDPRELRMSVDAEVRSLFLVLAAVCLFVGMVGIANTTLVSVLERVHEIGVRRALGAQRRDIAMQFLSESALVGTMGGIIGSCVGLLLVVGIATVRGWSPVVELLWVAPIPLVGTATGLVAGLYPSLKAAALDPVDALR